MAGSRGTTRRVRRWVGLLTGGTALLIAQLGVLTAGGAQGAAPAPRPVAGSGTTA